MATAARAGAPAAPGHEAPRFSERGKVTPSSVRAIGREPGGMRSDQAAIAGSQRPELLRDYVPSVGAGGVMLADYSGNQPGDPSRIAPGDAALT